MKAIVIGATSGIGKAVAKELVHRGYTVGITGRRVELLKYLQKESPDKYVIQAMDVTDTDHTLSSFGYLLGVLGDVDLIFINAGVGSNNPDNKLDKTLEMIDTNARAFAVLVTEAWKYFEKRGEGKLAGNTSFAATRANSGITYSATKAFASRYLEGFYLKSIADKRDISVTDIRPGFVDTDMIDKSKAFWISPCDKAARQIVTAIEAKKKRAYITKRWALLAFMIKLIPDFLYAKIS